MSERRPEAGSGGPAADGTMASSVTRHGQISEERVEGAASFTHSLLAAGVDSLSLGVGVDWGERWAGLEQDLAAMKDRAKGTDGVLWGRLPDRPAIFHAGGKPPMYRYHVETGAGHLFMAHRPGPDKFPNVYASVACAELWCRGLRAAVGLLQTDIEALGGRVVSLLPSRCDLCADLLIPQGLDLAFLQSHIVARSAARRQYLTGDVLESYYVGQGSGAIQLRIYDKAKETDKNGHKGWFLEVWGLAECAHVWRVEFQVRRQALKELGIDSLDDLESGIAGIWRYLTSDWASLRLPDDENSARRTVHPLWQTVQGAAARFGVERKIERDARRDSAAAVRRILAQIAGWVVSYAVATGIPTRDAALDSLGHDIRRDLLPWSFAERYVRKAVALGREVPPGLVDATANESTEAQPAEETHDTDKPKRPAALHVEEFFRRGRGGDHPTATRGH